MQSKHSQGKCPAFGKNCGKKEHFALCCKPKVVSELAEKSDFLGTVDSGNMPFTAKLKVKKLSVCFNQHFKTCANTNLFGVGK